MSFLVRASDASVVLSHWSHIRRVTSAQRSAWWALVAVAYPTSLRDNNELSIVANPLIYADCSNDTLISRLSMVPLQLDPWRTARGWAWPSARDEAGTGTIPRACKSGDDAMGKSTGIVRPLGMVALAQPCIAASIKHDQRRPNTTKVTRLRSTYTVTVTKGFQ